MADLDTLRPEVRSALGAMVRADVCRDSVPTDAFDIIRAELLRLADENARLNKIESLTTEQRLQMEDVELYLMDVSQPDDEDAPWCDRMKSAIELLVQDCNDAVGQKNKAEAELAAAQNTIAAQQDTMGALKRKLALVEGELAALKARIAGSDAGIVTQTFSHLGSDGADTTTVEAYPSKVFHSTAIGQRVRLVVEE